MQNIFPLLYYYIGFPGLGIKDFYVDKVAFSIGNIEIRWYAIMIVTGMVAAVIYTYLRAKRHGLIFDDLIDLALCAIVPGVIGARIYYVIFDYMENPYNYTDFVDFIAIWEGGLGIYGGLIAGVLGVAICLKVKKINIPQFLDCGFPGVLLAQSIGRWGNFFNTEAYGAESTWFCRMKLAHESGTAIYVHPTFLYESLWNFIGFLILTLITKKRKFDGQIFLMCVAWYGFGRMFIEGLRQDSLWLGKVRVSQALAAILFVLATALIIFLFIKNKHRHVARCIYSSQSVHYIPLEGVSDIEDYDYDYDINILYSKEKKAETASAELTNKDVATENPEKAEEITEEIEETEVATEETEEFTEENNENEEK